MRECLDYIIENDLYDMIIYSSDGDDITPGHMNYIKNKEYTLLHNSLVHSEHYNYNSQSDNCNRVFHIQTASRAIEVWIDAQIYLTTSRNIKINQILC